MKILIFFCVFCQANILGMPQAASEVEQVAAVAKRPALANHKGGLGVILRWNQGTENAFKSAMDEQEPNKAPEKEARVEDPKMELLFKSSNLEARNAQESEEVPPSAADCKLIKHLIHN